MTRLILLDRDGVINVDSPDYVKDADEWVPIPGALEAIARLKQAGYLVAVCSNQSAVGRGIISAAALERIHEKMRRLLARHGAALDGLRCCPHAPEAGCRCRKPMPGMLLDTLQDLGVPASATVFVGDTIRDMQAAMAAGCRPVLVRTGRGADAEAEARQLGVTLVAEDLADFVRHLESGSC